MTSFSKWGLSVLLTLSVYFFSPIHYVQNQIQPTYNEYMEIFKQYCKIDEVFFPKKTFITLGSFPKEQYQIGECSYYFPYRWNIILDRNFFTKYANDEEKLQLLAHELRHCFFMVDHSPDPNNYMYWDFPALTKQELLRQIKNDLGRDCQSSKE